MHLLSEKKELIKRMDTLDNRLSQVEGKVDHIIEIGTLTKNNTETLQDELQQQRNDIKRYIHLSKMELQRHKLFIILSTIIFTIIFLSFINKI